MSVGNPNLKEETADNYELGLKGRSNNSDFGISGFLNNYNNFLDKSNKTGNKVAYQVTDAAELNKTFPQVFNRFGAPADSGTIQATEYQTRNIFDVQLWGIEADYKYHFLLRYHNRYKSDLSNQLKLLIDFHREIIVQMLNTQTLSYLHLRN